MEEQTERLLQLFLSNIRDIGRRAEYNLLNTSVSQKMWSTEQYFIELSTLNINNFKVTTYSNYGITEGSTTGEYKSTHQPIITTTDSQYTGAIASHAQVINIPEYCRNLNRLLDGFFMNMLSVLDTMAHHIAILYTADNIPPKLYIWTIKDVLSPSHTNSVMLDTLDKRLRDDWFKDLRDYRDCTTHESLIPYEMRLRHNFISLHHETPEIYLPDAPKKRPPTYKDKKEPASHCEFILTNARALVNEVYKNVLLDVEKAKGILPIPKE